MKNAPKILCLLLALLCLPACADRRILPADPAETRNVRQNYARHAARAAQEHAAPSRMQASLRFGDKNDGRRVVVLLWGNGSGPIRLDVRAGIGASAAKILQDGKRFLLYSPQEERAYYHDDPRQAPAACGLPLPFGLRDLAALLAGDFGAVFGSSLPERAQSVKGNALRFELPEKTGSGGMLEVGPQGLPLAWKDEKEGWSVHFSYDDDRAPIGPKRLDARHADGKYAVLLVKERIRPPLPFTREQLELTLPPGTPLLPLEGMKRL